MTILEQIDKLRQERGWSVNNLAIEAMLTQSTLNNLYARKAEPKISTLRAICGAFGISLGEFFTGLDRGLDEDGDLSALDRKLQNRVDKLSAAQKKALLAFLQTVNTAKNP